MRNMRTQQYKKAKNVVVMDRVYSMEHYKDKNNNITQVLEDISFTAQSGEVWSVIGDSYFEINLLLEIIANTKPYQKGKCVLVETGMMKLKRIIVPHTFYIGTCDMCFNNMKVLEYLMFATGKSKKDVIDRQEELVDLLVELGLGYIILVNINDLSDEEKGIVSLIVATLSESKLIVFNIPYLKFNQEEINAIDKLGELIVDSDKTLIFSTQDYDLAQTVSNKLLILKSGSVLFEGSKDEFVNKYDNVILNITSDNCNEIKNILLKELPQLEFIVEDNYMEVLNYSDIKINNYDVYKILANYKIIPTCIEVNINNVKNSYREAVRNNDI